jgi:hypothetical protein
MKRYAFRLLAALILFVPAAWVQAASCTVTSPGFSTDFDPNLGSAPWSVQTYFAVACWRQPGDPDPVTVDYGVEATNGLYAYSGSNHARLNGNDVRYDTYGDSGCATQWNTNNANRLPTPQPATMSLNGNVTTTVTTSFWGCVPTAANAGASGGIHTDTVTISLYTSAGGRLKFETSGTFPVTINVTASCRISTAPGNIIFNYTAFGPAVNASTTFGTTCTNSLPYTMALDSTTGSLLGTNYSLALSATSATGTGAGQTYNISGTMAAGQAGTCSTGTCTATQSHTLIISY